MPDNDIISLGYTAVSCTDKEAVLLKSVIALYGLRGNINWQYQNSMEADFVIIGTEMSTSSVDLLLRTRIGIGQAVLWISDAPLVSDNTRPVFRCKPPLHPSRFANELKQVELFFRGGARHDRSLSASLSPQIEALRKEFPENFYVELVSWPSPEILSNDRLLWRLSAMLSARSMTVVELAERSSKPEDVCRQFLKRLSDAGCLKKISQGDHREPSPSSALRATQTTAEGGLSGLFRKIRVSLGLSSS
jgi:hypothetical protein